MRFNFGNASGPLPTASIYAPYQAHSLPEHGGEGKAEGPAADEPAMSPCFTFFRPRSD
jgi:hypothetical protein